MYISPSFEFALLSEGKNKMGAIFPVYSIEWKLLCLKTMKTYLKDGHGETSISPLTTPLVVGIIKPHYLNCITAMKQEIPNLLNHIGKTEAKS